ncbi:MAG: deoxyguanosinetriphosphate triphosphohydrolase family protein [Gammaproteobacteria bacterium]|nr:deoxyguanosinetriphosphate triphosphohydrolase family protein [Gammaproteobacteria bacterium]
MPESTVWTARRSTDAYRPTSFNAGGANAHYQRDRARLIHSAAFRSLQSKTQVLGLGESDYYRTRLTHSLEVAQIGSGIVEHLRVEAESDWAQWLPSTSLIESVCLGHDLGHPPFGHGGEVALNYVMRESGGFEGNGQTLRIMTRLGEFSPDCGLDPTRRACLGVLKYPVTYSEVVNYGQNDANPLDLSAWHPPKCVYDTEADVLDWIFEPFTANDRTLFSSIEHHPARHSRTKFKSFDASIMEVADDIAYGVHDLEDAVALGLVSREHLRAFIDSHRDELAETSLLKKVDLYFDRLFSPVPHERKHAISNLVGYLVRHIRVVRNDAFEHPLLAYNIQIDAPASHLLNRLKGYVFEEVIRRPEVQTLRYRGQQSIIQLWDILCANQDSLLPRTVKQQMDVSPYPMRVMCDYMSALTDTSATKLYHRLCSPGMGSIFEPI